jgi:bifunctional non-homologous end joining protein LigD
VADGSRLTVEVEGRRLTVSNLDKVLYPDGFTKGEVIDYYTRIAPTLLPHLRDRPLTLKRYPDGVDGGVFFQKNRPQGTPEWVHTTRIASPGSTKNRETVDYTVMCDLPTLVWAVNLASLELHVPMWRVGRSGEPLHPDLMVFDLDPGAPADIVTCCRVAALVRAELDGDGLASYPKTSGSKGLQLYVPLDASRPWEDVHGYAKALAVRLERAHPDLVVSNMKKELRPRKVLVDWSQNNAAKTTVAVYSLRARQRPTVSTPVTWDEVGACAEAGDPSMLVFTSDEVLARVEELAPVLDGGQRLPN